MFSRRTGWDLTENALAEERRRFRGDLLDLTAANPSACGLGPRSADALAPLRDPRGCRYHPTPRGLPEARAAVAAYYADAGAPVSVDQVLLTASTSEAYAFLFKLLADPGDRVLIPRPSYPLFDYLAGLEGLQVQHYPAGAPRGVRRGLEGGATCVVAVHPNNPTGATLDEPERSEITDLCARHGAALVVDEVFRDFAPGCHTFAGATACLTFTLSGLSKVCGLPGHKLGWIVASGPHADAALARLDIIADTFLSVGTPVQVALPALLAGRHAFQRRMLARVERNFDALRTTVADVAPRGGMWSAVVGLPEGVEDSAAALTLLRRHGVLVHPGFLFDFPTPDRLVVSLLPEPAVFDRAMEALAMVCRGE